MPSRARSRRGSQIARMRQLRDRRRLTARDHEPVDVRELRHRPDLDRDGARGREDADVLAEITLQGEDADLQGTAPYQPRSWSRVSSEPISSPCIGSPSPWETFARISGSLKWVVASTIARARGAGSSDL